MNQKGAQPGALLSFPGTEIVSCVSAINVDDDMMFAGVKFESWSGGGFAMGPAIVVGSIENADSEYIHHLYVVSSSALGWALVDRRAKLVEYIV